jgi:hypothetical protein
MRGGLTKGERTLREDWPVVDGGWRRAGVEEVPCELVREWCFLGSAVPVKQLRFQRKGGRARSVLGTQPDFGFQHQMLGKVPLSKKAHKKSPMSLEQSLMAGSNCKAGWGIDGAAPSLGKQ